MGHSPHKKEADNASHMYQV